MAKEITREELKEARKEEATCPKCGSVMLHMPSAGGIWLKCPSCGYSEKRKSL